MIPSSILHATPRHPWASLLRKALHESIDSRRFACADSWQAVDDLLRENGTYTALSYVLPAGRKAGVVSGVRFCLGRDEHWPEMEWLIRACQWSRLAAVHRVAGVAGGRVVDGCQPTERMALACVLVWAEVHAFVAGTPNGLPELNVALSEVFEIPDRSGRERSRAWLREHRTRIDEMVEKPPIYDHGLLERAWHEAVVASWSPLPHQDAASSADAPKASETTPPDEMPSRDLMAEMIRQASAAAADPVVTRRFGMIMVDIYGTLDEGGAGDARLARETLEALVSDRPAPAPP